MASTPRFADAIRQLDQTTGRLDVPADPPASPPVAPPSANPARTLVRLLVGAVLLGNDELARRAPEWERAASAYAPTPPASPAAAPDPEAEDALVGWLFVTLERVRPSWDPLRWAGSAGGHLLDTAGAVVRAALLSRSAASAPAPMADLQRWAAVGRAEGDYSRAIARAAFHDITDDVLNAVASSAAVQRVVHEIVQDQSATLANDAMAEVRDRAVVGDSAVEGFVRRLLRRPELPQPAAIAELAPGQGEA